MAVKYFIIPNYYFFTIKNILLSFVYFFCRVRYVIKNKNPYAKLHPIAQYRTENLGPWRPPMFQIRILDL